MTYHGVARLLRAAARQWPDKPALVSEGGTLTFRELLSAAGCVSRWLAEAGVSAGDRVVCAGENSLAMTAALLGTLDRGAVIVPLHPETPRLAVESLVRDSAPSALCLTESVRANFERTAAVPVLALSGCNALPWFRQERPADPGPPPDLSPGAIAALMYTSGSTGAPRAVICPHANVVFVVGAIASVLQYRREDIVLCTLPFSFDYGLYQIFLALHAGATLVLAPGLAQVHLVPRLLRAHDVSVLPGNPATVALLLRSGLLGRVALPALRLVTSTGEVLPEPHIQRLRSLFPQALVVPMYGLTECKRVSILPPGLEGRGSGSVGLPLPGTSVRIVGPDGRDLPPGEEGELVVRGSHVMAGYWNAPDETADRFRYGSDGSVELWTHDLFRSDPEEFLSFVGRSRSVIKSMGSRIGPSEVEAVIAAVPGVTETAVVGVPDQIRGEAVVAFVVADGPLDVADLEARCRDHLIPAARPVRFVISQVPLPKTRNGKVDREALRGAASRSVQEPS